jgi:SAM-dependent MidA family methyltransferase
MDMAFQKCDTQRPGADIRQEIARGGPVTFARFMELALYAPDCGYYERPRQIGRRGDYFTSVSVGPVFGELLACQFAQWLEEIAPPADGPWQMVEAGAHDGQLALDVLRWLRARRPGVFARLDYRIIEPSPGRRAWQERKLSNEFTNVTWARDFGGRGSRPVRGVIFCNELLDAMPVHRLFWEAAGKQWREWRVNWSRERFVWQKGHLSNEAAALLPRLPAGVEAVLPDGHLIEFSPAAIQWWSRAAASLERGKLLALDYGWDGQEWLDPARGGGSLRAYAGHRLAADILGHPGGQDLTAHVNFFLLREAGEAAGLGTEGVLRQSKFLTEIYRRGLVEKAGFEDWTSAQIRQFQTLTHPEHLGQRFRALIQSRR